MNNPVATAIRFIEEKIPIEILNAMLADSKGIEFGVKNALKDDILAEHVIPDCNMHGGQTMEATLEDSWVEVSSEGKCGIYRIPAYARDNRSMIDVHRITHALSLPFDYYTSHGAAVLDSSYGANAFAQLPALERAARSMMESKTGIGAPPKVPHVKILQGNMVKMTPPPVHHIPWILTFRVAYDDELSNLNTEAIQDFAKLAVLKTKMMAYTKLIIKIDAGEIFYGAELATFKEIVSGWGDLDEMYDDQLSHFNSCASFDLERMMPMIQMSMGAF